MEAALHQHTNNIHKNWLILDSEFTCLMICSSNLLTNIHVMEHEIKIKYNAIYKIINQKGYLVQFGNNVWCCPDGTANILAVSELCKHFQCNSHYA